MSQNRSSAVMQQRSEPTDSLDDFPTPPWATRALCEWLVERNSHARSEPFLGDMIARDPCANRGYMVAPLGEYFSDVEAMDIHDYGAGFEVMDYLAGKVPGHVHWTIMNPPFRLAEAFILRALETSTIGVAALVRTAFLESVGRFETLFSANPPTDVLQFTQRVVMHKGKVSEKGSTATAYCWVLWRAPLTATHNLLTPTRFHWIPPVRKSLEKPGDYNPRGAHVV